MFLHEIIKAKASASHVLPRSMAAYLGMSLAEYRDFEAGYDPATLLRVIQFVRFCVLFPGNMEELLAMVSDLEGPAVMMTFEEFTEKVGDISQQVVEIGLDVEGVKTFSAWLTDEETFAEMPVDSLADVCEYYGVDIRGVLLGYLHSIGVSIEASKS